MFEEACDDELAARWLNLDNVGILREPFARLMPLFAQLIESPPHMLNLPVPNIGSGVGAWVARVLANDARLLVRPSVLVKAPAEGDS